MNTSNNAMTTISKNDITVDTRNGSATVSIRRAARECGVANQTLFQHIEAASINPSKLVKALIEQGFKVAGWCEDKIPVTALPTIAEYYSFDARLTNDTAKRFYRTIAKAGAVAWAWNETGYRPNEPQAPKTFSEALRLAAKVQEDLEQAQLRIEQDKPKVEFAETVAKQQSSHELKDAAYLLNMSYQNFRKFLIENDYCFRNHEKLIGYSQYMSVKAYGNTKARTGLFEMKINTNVICDKDDYLFLKDELHVTNKGLIKFQKELNKSVDNF